MIANHDEASFGLLRYFLGGNRPSQTASLTMSDARIHGTIIRFPINQDRYFKVGSDMPDDTPSKPPGYPTHD